jgi:glycosyltransferase involved in cell wall biosynthesis
MRDGENGLLVDFFSPAEIAERVASVQADGKRFAGVRAAARRTVEERFDLRRICLPRQIEILESFV